MARKLPPVTCIRHAVNSLRSNLGFAFRISWPWYAVMAPVVIMLFLLAYSLGGRIPQSDTGTSALIDLIRGLVTMLAFASIAVNWHRYILLDEIPRGRELLRLDDKTWRYFGNLLLLILALAVAGGVAGAAIGLIAGLAGLASTPEHVVILVAVIVLPVAGVLALRWGVKFPAIALGRPGFSLRHAWAATRGNSLPLFLVFLFEIVIVVAAYLLIGLIAYLTRGIDATLSIAIAIALGLVVNWLFTVFSITVLTSLYGFFVEDREL